MVSFRWVSRDSADHRLERARLEACALLFASLTDSSLSASSDEHGGAPTYIARRPCAARQSSWVIHQISWYPEFTSSSIAQPAGVWRDVQVTDR